MINDLINSSQTTIISKVISLIQEARRRALTGAYGEQDVEYADVRERFEEAIKLLEGLKL